MKLSLSLSLSLCSCMCMCVLPALILVQRDTDVCVYVCLSTTITVFQHTGDFVVDDDGLGYEDDGEEEDWRVAQYESDEEYVVDRDDAEGQTERKKDSGRAERGGNTGDAKQKGDASSAGTSAANKPTGDRGRLSRMFQGAGGGGEGGGEEGGGGVGGGGEGDGAGGEGRGGGAAWVVSTTARGHRSEPPWYARWALVPRAKTMGVGWTPSATGTLGTPVSRRPVGDEVLQRRRKLIVISRSVSTSDGSSSADSLSLTNSYTERPSRR